ncbi:hypothetical protein Poli38472_010522 [Pythium oligandrum]|uniref:Uncharacterized protein n=1 Tax=Pythium oligandrum TaxID=41045 RepID=A0A8K1C3A6_PYTOL|nr:hypothetical protein Poli38472_010522 [Pythium oligandrum]|eukprot:TMW55640.1 hypothetical protein Poli38472_010522 [Pythium oligandrum]
MKLLGLVLAALPCTVDGLNMDNPSAQLSRRRGPGRGGVYEVSFSDAEESLLRERQGDTLEMISRVLNGRNVNEIQRRCIELGLRCGAYAQLLAKNTENWRRRKN